jgi:hypothetical protein
MIDVSAVLLVNDAANLGEQSRSLSLRELPVSGICFQERQVLMATESPLPFF